MHVTSTVRRWGGIIAGATLVGVSVAQLCSGIIDTRVEQQVEAQVERQLDAAVAERLDVCLDALNHADGAIWNYFEHAQNPARSVEVQEARAEVEGAAYGAYVGARDECRKVGER